MYNSHSNDQTNEDVFLLDRDQPAQPRQRPGTPPPNYNLINTAQHTITYEIIKTKDIHVVLVHEQPLLNAINVENEQGVIRRFTTDNPVIPDDEFVSPIRRFNPADRYSPNSTVSSPMSPCSSSEGYWSGSDWDSNSSWRSYDSSAMIYPNCLTLQSGRYPNSSFQMRQHIEAEDCHSPAQSSKKVIGIRPKQKKRQVK